MSYRFARVETAGRVLTVTLARPEVRNALHAEANRELAGVFDAFEADPSIWLAILTGDGDRAFSAGSDIRSGPFGGDHPPTGFAGLTHRFERTKPVIAAVNGDAVGGGFELALVCDLIIAAETARFGMGEPRVGMAPLGGGVQRLIREIGVKRANGLLLTGRLIPAREGLALGFVNEVVGPGEVMAAARRWAEEMLACSPGALRAIKAVANALDGRDLRGSIETMLAEPAVKAQLASADAREGPKAFAERRAPQWTDPEPLPGGGA